MTYSRAKCKKAAYLLQEQMMGRYEPSGRCPVCDVFFNVGCYTCPGELGAKKVSLWFVDNWCAYGAHHPYAAIAALCDYALCGIVWGER